jgi:hypothetical protein
MAIVDVGDCRIRYETWGDLGISGGDEYMRGTQRLLELIPRAEVVAVPDAAHTMILHDDRFRQAVLRFLSEAATP